MADTKVEAPVKEVTKERSLESVVAQMFKAMIAEKKTQAEAKAILIQWWESLNDEAREKYRTEKNELNEVLRRCVSAIDVVTIEVKYVTTPGRA